jgi:alanine racemase
MASSFRPAWAEVDLGAIRANAAALAKAADGAALCAVVKADGYGHGAVPVARAALDGGATWLAVALVEEGVVLREAGLEAPILVLSEPPVAAMADVVAHRLTPTLYTRRGVEALAGSGVAVHVKVDTGMHRVGATPEDAIEVALAALEAGLSIEGLWTHFAVADEPDSDFTARQQERFENARSRFADAGLEPHVVHTANSAAALLHPDCRYDMVRCGISLYGYRPAPGLDVDVPLRPAMTLRAEVSHVRDLGAGERLSYGLRYELQRRSTVATVPLGYADGVPRRLSTVGAEVLVGGRRCPIAGTITMDQLMVDCGPDAPVAVGDEVVLLGGEITADDWAQWLDTISYEILCGIGPRVPRVYVDS